MTKRSDLWLQGWRIIALRPDLDLPLEGFIQAHGGMTVHLPMINIVPVEISDDLLQLWQFALKQSSLLFIASQNAVHAAPSVLLQTIASIEHLKIITMGKATSLAATQAGLAVFYTPPPGTTSETLLREPFLQQSALEGATVTLLAGVGGRTLLAETLASRGARVQWCQVYRQEKVPYTHAPILKAWLKTDKNCFLATSLNILENLLELTAESEKAWLLRQPFIVISERIAQHAKKWGIQHIFIAKGTTPNLIAQALQEVCGFCDTTK